MAVDEILKLEATPEANILVAEKVMGWIKPNAPEPKCPECGVGVDRPKCFLDLGGYCPRHEVYAEWKANEIPPDYTGNILDAWQIVEKSVDIELSHCIWTINGRWECGIRLEDTEMTMFEQADTAPLAICRAALLAVMENGK